MLAMQRQQVYYVNEYDGNSISIYCDHVALTYLHTGENNASSSNPLHSHVFLIILTGSCTCLVKG